MAKILTGSKLFLSSHFTIKKRAIFENKFFIVFFIFFLKQTAVKLLIYAVGDILLFLFSGKRHDKMINIFPVAGVNHLMVSHVSNTLNV